MWGLRGYIFHYANVVTFAFIHILCQHVQYVDTIEQSGSKSIREKNGIDCRILSF